jgi:N6-adenosine-specific RNA methylase IME4
VNEKEGFLTAPLVIDERVALPTGLRLPDGLPLEEWQEIGRRIALVTRASLWWWGDWVNYGQGRYEHGRYEEALEHSDYDPGTLADASWVASAFESSRRREDLPWSHHREVAPLSLGQQDYWLDQAAAKRWSKGQLRQELKQKRLADRHVALPTSLDVFEVIVADPPWRYEFAESDTREIENQYPTMTLEEIKAYPNAPAVPDEGRFFPAADDAMLFLWATSPKLRESFEVVEAWGFDYRTCAIWDKERIGMGYYFRQQHELLLVARRGEPPMPLPDARPPSIIRERRDNEHSRKPARHFDLIREMWPAARRAVFFHRGAAPEGYTAYGNEVEE